MARAGIPFARGAGAPVKLNLDIMDNVASGALLQLGDTQIGNFTKEVVRWGNATDSLRRSLFYYVGDGAKEGAGRFSAGLATHVKEWVQQAILFPSARKKNVAQGFYGPARKNPEYVQWMRDIGRGDQLTMHLFGTLAQAFTVIRSSSGGHTLGISRTMTARQPIKGSNPVEFGATVKVGKYAAAVELGIGMPARPIMTGAIVGWLEKALPEWAKSLRKYMFNSYNLGLDEWGHTGVNPLDQQDAGYRELEVDLLKEAHLVKALLSKRASTVSEADHKFDTLANKIASGEVTLTPVQQSALAAHIERVCLDLGTPYKTIPKIIQAVQNGKVPETVAAGPARAGG